MSKPLLIQIPFGATQLRPCVLGTRCTYDNLVASVELSLIAKIDSQIGLAAKRNVTGNYLTKFCKN